MAATTSLYFAVFAASCALLAASVSSLPPAVFSVGDDRGWTVPSGNGTESYNHWAKRNRFQVGDVLEFKYANNDSVLLVSHDDYKQCSTETPLSRFTDGDTKFTFDRYGLFYFVSGVPGHCEAGQRMITRVMAPSALTGAPAAAPPGMPPTVVPAGAPSPVSSSSPSPAGFGAPPSGSSPTVVASSTPSPSPLPPPASGASSSRHVISIVSSIVLGLVVVAVLSLFVLV